MTVYRVVTRTDYTGTELETAEPGKTSRDTRYLTRDEVSRYMDDIRRDVRAFNVSGTVHVDGKKYATFGPSLDLLVTYTGHHLGM